jgi:F-type H+-transporting ATPase subunit delta
VIVSEQASTSKGIATRYATAVFGLADEQDDIQTLEQNVGILKEALDKSMDLTSLISSPIYSRDQQQAAITAIAKKLKLSPVLTNTLSLMATKRRLFVAPTFLAVLSDLIAASKNEVTAEVVSATSLSKEQLDKLAKTLKVNFNKDIKISATVDPALIGGMIVKVGSRMIDTTIKSKLNSLQNVMKEVG